MGIIEWWKWIRGVDEGTKWRDLLIYGNHYETKFMGILVRVNPMKFLSFQSNGKGYDGKTSTEIVKGMLKKFKPSGLMMGFQGRPAFKPLWIIKNREKDFIEKNGLIISPEPTSSEPED